MLAVMPGINAFNRLCLYNESQRTMHVALSVVLLFAHLVCGQTGSDTITVNNTDPQTVNVTTKSPIEPPTSGTTPSSQTTDSGVPSKPFVPASEHTNCHVLPNDTTIPSTIKAFLNEGAKLIKYNLQIENEDEVLANISQGTMYEPLYWIRTTGRQGRGILLLRPEYDTLSLTTLEFGVYTLNVTLRQYPRRCLAQLNYSDIEQILRELVMNDFQNTSSGNIMLFSPTEDVCNMHVLNESGVAEFRFVCCNRTDTLHIECRVLETEIWLDVLFGVIMFIKVLVLLFSPNMIPDSIYRLKHITVPFVYITEPDEKVRLKVAITTSPGTYRNAQTVCKVSKFRHMTKFKTTIQKMIPDVTYDFSFDKVELMLKQKRLLYSGSAPVGFYESLFETIVKCKIRNSPSVQPCCDANICSKWVNNRHYSWYRLLKEVMNALMLILITLPWIVRVWIYYSHEHEELAMRREVANEKGLQFYFPGSITLYLTPLHALFVVMYIVLCLESFVFGVLERKTKEKLKFVLRKCFNDMREFDKQRVLGWVVQVMLLPCVTFGIFGFLVAPIIWIIMLPIALLISAFYVFPTINLTIRLFAHFIVYLMPRELYTRCKFSSITSRAIGTIEKTLETRVDMKELTETESVEKNETALRTKCGRFQQLIIIIFCLISLYSCIFLLTEFVSFFVEIVVYTMIGIILNASVTLTYISLGLYIVFYANDVVGNVGKKFITFSSTLNSYILGLGKSQAEPVFFKNFEKQLNRAFRVKTGRPCVPKRPVTLVKNDENEPRWNFSKLVLFITNSDQPQIPKKFYFSACNMPYSMVPGQLFASYISAFKELGLIIVFLVFVLIVVLAFGETYELSATNHLLATMASGFIPLMLRRVLFKTHSVPAIDTSSDINFQVCIFDLLNSFSQCWPIYDIDVSPNGLLSDMNKGFVSTEGLENEENPETNTTDADRDEMDNKNNENAAAGNANQPPEVDEPQLEGVGDDERMDLVIDIREVDTDDFPNMFSGDHGRDVGSMSFLDETGENIALSAVSASH